MEENKSCCCGHNDEHKHEEKSCCSSHKDEIKGESCCCSSHKEEHESSSCCSSGGGGCCEHKSTLKKDIIILAISLASLVVSFLDIIPFVDPAWIAIILCGKDIFISAYKSAKRGKITSSILISVAMIASVALEIFMHFGGNGAHDHGSSYIFAAGEIAFLMYLGETLEEGTVNKSKEGVKKLASLIPENALKVIGETVQEVKASTLSVDDIVLVNPNEKMPADGIVICGESVVDNSMLTGESEIIDIKEGSEVFGGAWNGHGQIKVKVTRKPEDMAVSRLVELTKEAQGKKAPIARIADKWASILVPTACLLSIIVFLFAFFVLKASMIDSLVRGVSVLVVFCPCALTLATPTAISAAIGSFSKQGVLIKSGSAIEGLAQVKNVAFDKTGTLTKGKLSITNISCECSEHQFFSYLKSAEASSNHPIAKTIMAYEKGEVIPTESAEVLSGIGVKCVVEGDKIEVKKLSAFQNPSEEAISWTKEGKTVIGVSKNDQIIGYVALSDTVRDEAKSAIDTLKGYDVDVHMLTGDNKETAYYIGDSLRIKNVNYALLPHQKTVALEAIKQTGKTAFVGDGVNDTPALAMSDVGISMSVFGSDIATENADVSLFTEDLTVLPWLLKNSKRVLRTIKGNITGAMVVNCLAIVLSAFGILNPVTGALLHNCTSVFVVLNSCRLLSIKR